MTRRQFLKIAGMGAGSVFAPTLLHAQSLAPNLGELYARYQVAYANTHAHSVHSDAVSALPSGVLGANLNRFDVAFLTDHGEQLSQAEWGEQARIAAQLSQNGKVALRGFEWTDPLERRTADGRWTPDPAYINSRGHVVVLRTDDYCGVAAKDGGEPYETGQSFLGLLRWIAERPQAMGIFAHPSLYPVETSFDGFRGPVPQLPTLVDQFVGCELARIGDGLELRSCDEAGFRELLRKGWRVAPVIGGDEHHPPYGTAAGGTGLYLTERSARGVYEALWHRRCFATEDLGSCIKLGAWSGTGAPVVMGRTLGVSGDLGIYAEVETEKKLKRITFVFVSKKGADLLLGSDQLSGQPRFGEIVALAELARREIVCAYARAELSTSLGGLVRHVVSAPVWLTY